jgi:predicted glycosyltransferase
MIDAQNGSNAIWFDFDNSPHVPLFTPFVRHYQANGIKTVLTARSHSQTIGLLGVFGLLDECEVIGKHHGKNPLNKVLGLVARSIALVSHIRRQRAGGTDIRVAVSHGSRAMVLAARFLRIPVVTMFDYEYTETWIFRKFSTVVLVPDQITDEALDQIGVAPEKRVKYPGLKEEIYLGHYKTAPDFRRTLEASVGAVLPEGCVLVVLRPSATTANYHDAASEGILVTLLTRLLNSPETFTAIVPRTREQRDEIQAVIDQKGLSSGNYGFLRSEVNGLDLIEAADLVVSGGGTMNREAVLLGIPVYSFFSGRTGALDRELERSGRLRFLRTDDDVAKIPLVRNHRNADFPERSNRVEAFVRGVIDSFLD